MGEYEDAVQQLEEEGRDDLVETFKKFTAGNLRQKAARADELSAKLQETEARIQRLEGLPKKERALREAGVDLDSLRPAEKLAIETMVLEGEPGEEWAKKVIEDWQFPVRREQDRTAEEQGLGGVVRAATSAPAGGSRSAPVVRPSDLADVPLDRLLRFKEKYPEEWEALSRGYEVTGVTL